MAAQRMDEDDDVHLGRRDKGGCCGVDESCGYDSDKRRKAWEFRLNHLLPRYYLGEKGEKIKVPYGKEVKSSKLFDWWRDEVDPVFGIGICVYFRQTYMIGLLAFICGCFQIYTSLYYASREYDKTKNDGTFSLFGLGHSHEAFYLRYTAECADFTAVCLNEDCTTYAANCNPDFGKAPELCDAHPGHRAHRAPEKWGGYKMHGHKDCDITDLQVYLDLGMTFCFAVALYFIRVWGDAEAEKFDTAQQTAQDYSVEVHDPEPDATDPEEWHAFFSQFGQVFSITVCINNGHFLELLREKRILENRIKDRLRNAKKSEEDIRAQQRGTIASAREMYDAGEQRSCLYNILKSLGMVSAEDCVKDLGHRIRGKIAGGEKQYKACKIYCIFNTEHAQQRCLAALKRPMLATVYDWPQDMPKEHIFRGTNVLRVNEAPEPTDVIHENLKFEAKERAWRSFTSLAIYGGLLYAIFELLNYMVKLHAQLAASILVCVLSLVIPVVIELIVWIEVCHSTSDLEDSFFVKTVISRWFVTVFTLWLICEFTDHNRHEQVGHIIDIMLLECFLAPIYNVLDPVGAFQRWVVAPFAPTQMQANSLHMATRWQLSERYSHLATHFMLSMLNSTLIPYGFFITALACFLQYWSDKFGLVRLYQQLPPVNDRLSKSTRACLSLCLLVHFLFTCYYYSGWPFDFLCPSHHGSLSTTGEAVAETYDMHGKLWKICDQRFFETKITDQDAPYWNHHQRVLVHVYRNLGLAICITLMVYMFLRGSAYSVYNLFFLAFDDDDEIAVTDIPYTDVVNAELYVPQINMYSMDYVHPLQCAEMTYDDKHLCWAANSHEEYLENNLYYDPIFEGLSDESKRGMFSKVAQYMPEERGSGSANANRRKGGALEMTPVEEHKDQDSFEMHNPLMAGKKHDVVDIHAHLDDIFDAMDREGLSEEQAHDLMDAMTDEHDGHIDKHALLAVLEHWHVYKEFLVAGAHDEAAKQLWHNLDTNGNGDVSFEEFKQEMKLLLGPLCPADDILRSKHGDATKWFNDIRQAWT